MNATKMAMSSLGALIALIDAAGAHAQHALVMSTSNKEYRTDVAWQLAEKASESQYKEIEKYYSGQAIIYGIPMGAKYDDIKKNVNAKKRASSAVYSSSVLEN